mmetsp:Transcript_1233/g.3063  ORF Transcript_1233/g.3063 Transcript_1233/m.3063 type:complete len:329 (+) Transcript_1233:460-1446(+)
MPSVPRDSYVRPTAGAIRRRGRACPPRGAVGTASFCACGAFVRARRSVADRRFLRRPRRRRHLPLHGRRRRHRRVCPAAPPFRPCAVSPSSAECPPDARAPSWEGPAGIPPPPSHPPSPPHRRYFSPPRMTSRRTYACRPRASRARCPPRDAAIARCRPVRIDHRRRRRFGGHYYFVPTNGIARCDPPVRGIVPAAPPPLPFPRRPGGLRCGCWPTMRACDRCPDRHRRHHRPSNRGHRRHHLHDARPFRPSSSSSQWPPWWWRRASPRPRSSFRRVAIPRGRCTVRTRTDHRWLRGAVVAAVARNSNRKWGGPWRLDGAPRNYRHRR